MASHTTHRPIEEPYQTQMLDVLSASVVRPLRVQHVNMPLGSGSPKQLIPWHTLAYFVDGEVEYTFFTNSTGPAGERRRFGRGSLLWMPQGIYRGMRVCSQTCRLYSFQFGLRGNIDTREYGLPNQLFDALLIKESRHGEHWKPLFQRLYWLWVRRSLANLLEIQGITLQLIAQLKENDHANTVSPYVQWKVEVLLQYLHHHYSDPTINLERLAHVTGWSPKYLIGVFRRVTGQSPIAYLQQLRIQRSMELLGMSGLPIAAVAEAVGYDDPSYFARLFRKHTGTPPSTFRRADPATIAL